MPSQAYADIVFAHNCHMQGKEHLCHVTSSGFGSSRRRLVETAIREIVRSRALWSILRKNPGSAFHREPNRCGAGPLHEAIPIFQT